MPFVKLDCGILDSSLWAASPETKVTFVTMLAMAEPTGLVRATAPGIAQRAHLRITNVRAALVELEAPDPDSRTLAYEGRRVLRVDGGYQVVNYEQYRNRDYTAADRKRRQRDREREEDQSRRDNVTGHGGSRQVTHAKGDADVDAEQPPPAPPAGGRDGQAALGELSPAKLVEQLAAEFIAAGGDASRTWTRNAKRLLRARGREAGVQLIRDEIAALRASTAAGDKASSLQRRLIAQARTSGRDGGREWGLIVDQLQATMDEHRFGTWIRPLAPVGVIADEEGDRLLVSAPDSMLDWLGQNYQGPLADAADQVGLALSVLFVSATLAGDGRS